VRAPGGGAPSWIPLAIAGGVIAVIALIAYLIFTSQGDDGGLADWEKAQLDDSPDLPGQYIPPQGRGHFNYTYSPGRTPRPFCEGVEKSAGADVAATPSGSVTPTTPTASSTPTLTATPPPSATGEASGTTSPRPSPTPPQNCYASNPPSSGQHLGVQRNVDLGNGAIINIPADPDVYPEDVFMPRESIPHILEHAGVFVGYHCAGGDQACLDVVEDLKGLVNDRIDNHNDRVVMANDPDLPEGTIGVASWTRVMNVRYQDYNEGEVEDFIATHECRFDPEGFCD
jgi:hypothetical protein